MTRNAVGWFEIYVQDMDRAKAFYEGVFARTLTRIGSPDLAMWSFGGDPNNNPGTNGALVKAPAGMPSGGNSIVVYFSCLDCATEGARVAGAGGTVVRDKLSIGEYGFIVLAKDTEGNMFGLHSMR